MNHSIFVALYLLVMGALIVTLDVLFLQNHLVVRLLVNIGIVAIFATAYLVFFRDAFK